MANGSPPQAGTPQNDKGTVDVGNGNGRYFHIRAELLGILVLILTQTFGAIWWASRTEERLRGLEGFYRGQTAQVERIHNTQVDILQELARLRQALENAECLTTRGGGGGALP